MFLNGEVTLVTKYSPENPFSFLVIFIFAVSMGCFLNYTLFLCTSLTSALTTSVVGGLKAMVQTLFGLFTFGGISHNLPTYIGISMNLSGGVWYIYEKYAEGQRSGKGSSVLRKITSLSTAEDFHKIKTQQSLGNGFLASPSNLQSISEEIHERHQSHSNDTVISFDQRS
jgi:solute carrier family 35 protein